MKTLSFVYTSVFSLLDNSVPFSGNQLATFWNVEETQNLSTEEMQGIAKEINFSETTFVVKDSPIPKIRIFTPTKELKFAGHPTLGTAYVLKQKKLIPESKVTTQLELGIGPITVDFEDQKQLISMTQPKPEFLDQFDNYFHLAKALSLQRNDFSSTYMIQYVSTGMPYLLVPLNSIKAVEKTNIDKDLLKTILEDKPSRDILVFTLESKSSNSHVHARMFAPEFGISEDPATGSAAGPLGAYLDYYEVLENHKKGNPIIIEQGYEMKRPSKLISTVLYENNNIIGVKVSGHVKTIAEGNYFL